MKKLELNDVKFMELNLNEMTETNGGFVGLLIAYALQAGLVACLAGGVYASFKAGRAAVR